MSQVFLPFAKEAMIQGAFRHYKGEIYFVHGIVSHVHHNEKLVIYSDQQSKSPPWARSIKEFQDVVLHKGRSVPRFEPIKFYEGRWVSRTYKHWC